MSYVRNLRDPGPALHHDLLRAIPALALSIPEDGVACCHIGSIPAFCSYTSIADRVVAPYYGDGVEMGEAGAPARWRCGVWEEGWAYYSSCDVGDEGSKAECELLKPSWERKPLGLEREKDLGYGCFALDYKKEEDEKQINHGKRFVTAINTRDGEQKRKQALEKTKVLYEKIRERRMEGKGAVQKAKVSAI
jgi:hypothetical protein